MSTIEQSILKAGYQPFEKTESFWLFAEETNLIALFLDEDLEKKALFRGTTFSKEEIGQVLEAKPDLIPDVALAGLSVPIAPLKVLTILYKLVKVKHSTEPLSNKIFFSKTLDCEAIPLFENGVLSNMILLSPNNGQSFLNKEKRGSSKMSIGETGQVYLTFDIASFRSFNQQDRGQIILLNPLMDGWGILKHIEALKLEGFPTVEYFVKEERNSLYSYIEFLCKLGNSIGEGDSYLQINKGEKGCYLSLSYNNAKPSIKSVSFFNTLKTAIEDIGNSEVELLTQGHKNRKQLTLYFPFNYDILVCVSGNLRSYFKLDILPFLP